jgi:adenosine deaminase
MRGNDMSDNIRVGLIGYGYASKTFHAPLIAGTPGLELAVISSSDETKVKADWPTVTVVSEPKHLFNGPNIDLIDGVREGCRTFGVQAKLIGIMSRTFGEAACQQELEAFLAHRDQITALDLAGDELGFPGSLFLSHFNRARDAGWHITVHAGEAAGPESIWQAIRELGAERIGHGVKAIEDRALMDFLAEQQIGIESCLTSNIQTSTVAELAAHPLKTFLEHGIRASINTDDPGVQGVDIIHEYTVAAPAAGLSREQIRQAQINGLEMAFLSAEEKRALREKVAAK